MSGGGGSDRELEWNLSKVVSRGTRGELRDAIRQYQIQLAHFFILIIHYPFTVIPGDRNRFGIDDQSIHTGLAQSS